MNQILDVNSLLDPEIAQALADLNLRFDTLSARTLPKIRKALAGLPPLPVSDAVSRINYDVAGRSAVNVRVHRENSADGKLPCIYWMHGGGLIVGTNVGDDPRFDKWCPNLNCMAASVEYGLAPESRYPDPLEDCYAGLKWIFDNADRLGIERGRIGIGGASAGAGLAAGLALLARDRGEVTLAFQALIYPMLDDRQITVSSQWNDPVWPPNANRFGWDSYLGDLTDDAVPHYAAAARADDLRNLPATFISVGALDGFADEDIDYANRLRHSGVPCELHVYPGAPHGFDALTPNTAIARRADADIRHWLAIQLHGS
jgi:acetyl esterase/lipase